MNIIARVSNVEQTRRFVGQWFNYQFEIKITNKTIDQHFSKLRELCRLVLGDAKINALEELTELEYL